MIYPCRCGSYDHFLYALNHKHKCCIYKVSCGGSIYASPCIDTHKDMLYVGSTRGLVTAIKLEVLHFSHQYFFPKKDRPVVFGENSNSEGTVQQEILFHSYLFSWANLALLVSLNEPKNRGREMYLLKPFRLLIILWNMDPNIGYAHVLFIYSLLSL